MKLFQASNTGDMPQWTALRVAFPLLVCAALIAINTIAAAQPFPGPIPAWYTNSSDGILIYQDASVRILWKHSYVYRAPGDAAYYWYAQVVYQNIGKKALPIRCDGPVLVHGKTSGSGTQILEGMHGTPNAGYVPAQETLCTHNPNYARVIDPGGSHYDWAIFHNVPWKVEGSLASLGWGPYGFSQWADPWSSPTSRNLNNIQLPAPAECPAELVALGTCRVGEPQGTAQNLVVLVHGCCTNEADLWEWNALADQVVGKIIDSRPTSTWEIVVRDWTKSTPKPSTPPIDINGLLYDLEFLQDANSAYDAAEGHGLTLANAISKGGYKYIHLIAHSAGSRLTNVAANQIAKDNLNKDAQLRPFIHLTFLDAYTRFTSDDNGPTSYGSIPDYSQHYSEHYVDVGLGSQTGYPSTDSKLAYALNFDVTAWMPVARTTPDEKQDSGHQWPRYWYERSVITPGYRFGYSLSLEGGGSIDRLNQMISNWPTTTPAQPCMLYALASEEPQNCDFVHNLLAGMAR